MLFKKTSPKELSEYSQTLFWKNISTWPIKTHLGFIASLEKDYFKETFFRKIKPSIIWTGTNSIKDLESLILDSRTKELFEKKGLDIYLYEPMCFKTSESHNRLFYSEFTGTELLSKFKSDELDSVETFIKNNNIKNFIVHCCEYNIQLIATNYPTLNLVCNDLFLKTICPLDKVNTKNIQKKFLCTNWRYTPHRHLIMAYLSRLDGNYSWQFNCNFDILEDTNWLDFKKLPQKIYNQLKTGGNYLKGKNFVIDVTPEIKIVNLINSATLPEGQYPTAGYKLKTAYKNTFCAVVTETRFAQPFANISEKTYKTIEFYTPFILVAPPHSLKYFKELGFKTFDKWWDESYDAEENHQERMIKIFNTIDYINSLSYDKLSNMYKEMKPVLDHNFKLMDKILGKTVIL